MNRNNDLYTEEDDDNELWDDELDISADDSGNSAEDPDQEDATQPQGNLPDDYYSEPAQPAGQQIQESGRKSFFTKEMADEDFDNDFYDSDAEPAKKKLPEPKLDPEDPDYWIEEPESHLGGIIPTPRKRWKWWLAAAGAAIIGILALWIWFLRPFTDSAVKYGYIKNMERRGTIIKTFEGTMIPYKEIGDPDPLYYTEFPFSVASDSVAARMKRMMLRGIPVRVEYEVYHSALPWKGEQKTIIVKADSADTRSILPPEYRYK